MMAYYNKNWVSALASAADEELKLLRAVRATLTRYTADESLKPLVAAITNLVTAVEDFQKRSPELAFADDGTGTYLPNAVMEPATAEPSPVRGSEKKTKVDQVKQETATSSSFAEDPFSAIDTPVFETPDLTSVELGPDDIFPILSLKTK